MKYPVDVRLLAPSLGREVRGRSLNLSASGILVEARGLMEVGTRVLCEIPLPGGVRKLSGEVARLQPLPFSSSAVGLGIRFVELDAASQSLLQNLVKREENQSHLVRARFDGLTDSLRSQAVLTPEGVKLSTALPFLRPGSTVGIAFVSGASRVLSRGTVRDAQLEPRQFDGVPRLTVDVQLCKDSSEPGDDGEEVTAVDTPRARASRPTPPSMAVPSSVPHPEGEPVRRRIDRSGRRPLSVRGRPRRAPLPVPAPAPSIELSAAELEPAPATPLWLSRALKLGVGVTAGLALLAVGAGVTRLSISRQVPRLPPAPALVPVAARVQAAPAPAAILGPRVALARAADESPPPATLPPTLQLPWRRLAAAAGAPAVAPAVAPPVAPEEEPQPATASARLARVGQPGESYTQAALRTAVPLPEETPGPEISEQDGEIVAEVPFEGSTQGMSHYPLAEPRGVAVNLPNGRSTLALGLHRLRNDGLRGVWIRQHERGGIQVRFTLAYRTPEVVAVEVEDGLIRLRVAPRPR